MLIETGEFANGETYEIRRDKSQMLLLGGEPYTLNYAFGNIKTFPTMLRAKSFLEGYARGRETWIKTTERINL